MSMRSATVQGQQASGSRQGTDGQQGGSAWTALCRRLCSQLPSSGWGCSRSPGPEPRSLHARCAQAMPGLSYALKYARLTWLMPIVRQAPQPAQQHGVMQLPLQIVLAGMFAPGGVSGSVCVSLAMGDDGMLACIIRNPMLQSHSVFMPAGQSLQAPCAMATAYDSLSDVRRSCTGTGKEPNVTKPDQVTVAPNESIQDAEGFGLQQGPSSPSSSSSSSPAGEHWPERMTWRPCTLPRMWLLCSVLRHVKAWLHA